MAQSLGNFGTPRDEVEADFNYFGLVVRVHPDMSDLVMVDFMERLGKIDEEDVAAGMHALSQLLTSVVHPDDFETFWRTAKANRQTLQDIMEVAALVIQAAADRPTVQPSDSSGGPTHVVTSSEDDSSHRAQRRLEEAARGDLALVVQQARAARAG